MNLASRDRAVAALSLTMTATAIAIALLPRTERAPLGPIAAPAPAPLPLPPGARFSFVFRDAGTTYMQLEDLGNWYPGDIDEQRVYEDDNVDSFIHPLHGRFVPPDDRAWLGREVVLDTGCRARVTGFALVARVVGDPDWVWSGDTTWDPVLLRTHAPNVIAASLDGCTGTYARDASLPPVAVPVAVDDPALAARAQQLLVTSAIVDPEVVVKSRVLRHPVTGDTWVVVTEHRDHGCGDPEVNLFGLYRLGPYGALLVVEQRQLDELDTIDALVDLDGDGQLEVIGHAWLQLEQLLVTHSGKELARSGPKFIGCPC